jgi:hypothetical protein
VTPTGGNDTTAWGETLNALVIGGGSLPPASSGIACRPWASLDVALPREFHGRPLLACLAHSAEFDTTPLAWADVLVLRNTYAVAAACFNCPAASFDEAVLLAHAAETGHEWRRPHEGLVFGLVDALVREPRLLRGRAIVYELDEDPWASRPSAGTSPAGDGPHSPLDLEFVRLLLRVADVVVVDGETARAAALREGAREVVALPAENAVTARAEGWRSGARRAGTGMLQSAGGSPAAVESNLEEAGRRLDERVARRARDREAAALLAGLRAAAGVCWTKEDAIDPLVSVVIATVNEPESLVELSIRSALDTECVRVEVVVAGPRTAGGEEVVRRLADDRVVHVDVPDGDRDDAAIPGTAAWLDSRRGRAMRAAHRAARGSWLAPLSPGSVFLPNHVALLLEVALGNGLEIVYGEKLLASGGHVIGRVGSWPPAPDAVAHDASIVAGALRAVEPDPDAWLDGEGVTWNLWRRWLDLGARMGNVEEVVTVQDVPEAAVAAGPRR